jgi:hypothetical protein
MTEMVHSRENNNATRYFVNIGSRDNFDWMSLKDYLKETLDLGRDDVFKVDVKEGSLSLTQIQNIPIKWKY